MLWMSVINGELRMKNGKYFYVGKFLLKIFGIFTFEIKDLTIPKKEHKCR